MPDGVGASDAFIVGGSNSSTSSSYYLTIYSVVQQCVPLLSAPPRSYWPHPPLRCVRSSASVTSVLRREKRGERVDRSRQRTSADEWFKPQILEKRKFVALGQICIVDEQEIVFFLLLLPLYCLSIWIPCMLHC